MGVLSWMFPDDKEIPFYSTKLRRKVKISESGIVYDISKNGRYYLMAVYPDIMPYTDEFDKYWNGEYHMVTKFTTKEDAVRFNRYRDPRDFKDFKDRILDWWKGE